MPIHAYITPDMRIFVPGYGDMTEDVTRELIRQENAELAELAYNAERLQALICAENPGPARLTKGFALKAQIDRRVFAHWERREGRGFWKHELRNMIKRHPELGVKAVADKPTVHILRRRDQ